MKLADIHIRDPFVFAENGFFYLFGSTDDDIWKSKATGFDAYKCRDISADDWTGPISAFRPAKDFWSDTNFWAPEIHSFNGDYYMFATFKPKAGMKTSCRGTAILKSASKSPEGPYLPHSNGAVTPSDWECLDGTFWQENGTPYMIFCHEWQQVGDGQICVMRLSADLKSTAGEPRLLFTASEAPWSAELARRAAGSFVTDGPFLHRCGAHDKALGNDGELVMLWSSFDADGNYAIGTARSNNGSLFGKWTQSEKPLYCADGGHGMVFRAADKLYLAIHTPNKTPLERAVFIELAEK